jgi:hypothetical protein
VHREEYREKSREDAKPQVDLTDLVPTGNSLRFFTGDENMTWNCWPLVRATFVLAEFANIELTVFFPKGNPALRVVPAVE